MKQLEVIVNNSNEFLTLIKVLEYLNDTYDRNHWFTMSEQIMYPKTLFIDVATTNEAYDIGVKYIETLAIQILDAAKRKLTRLNKQ